MLPRDSDRLDPGVHGRPDEDVSFAFDNLGRGRVVEPVTQLVGHHHLLKPFLPEIPDVQHVSGQVVSQFVRKGKPGETLVNGMKHRGTDSVDIVMQVPLVQYLRQFRCFGGCSQDRPP